MSTDGGEPGKGAGSKSSGSKANKQLRELQRLMAWAWDSRVEEHPPGAKAMHDFENVLNFQLDTSRRRRGTATPVQAAKDRSAGSTPAADGCSAARHARRAGSAERGTKRASPAPQGSAEGGKAGRKPSKAARVETSPALPVAAFVGSEAGAATKQQQQQQQQSSHAPQGSNLAGANQAADRMTVAAPSPAAAVAGAAVAMETTPATRLQPQQQDSPPSCAPLVVCPSEADLTPAVELGGVALTPSTLATALPSRGMGGAAALADAHFMPTPAPTPVLLASVLGQPGGDEPATAPVAAPEPQFRAPAPRSLMTSLKRRSEAEAAPATAGSRVAAAEAEAAAVGLPEPAAAAPAADKLGPAESGSAGTAEAAAALGLLAEGPAAGGKRAVPAIFVGAAGASTCSRSSSGSPMEVDRAEPPVATPAAAAAEPAVVSSELPTPTARAMSAAEQLLFCQPLPAACPPLFKQVPVAGAAKRAPVKSPLGGKRRSPTSAPAGKENASLNSSSSGLTPRTAEPAPPPQAALSAWKQQQLVALSAGFHSRQRRLLELLSACNRLAHASPAAASTPGAAAQAAPASTGSGSGGKAAKAGGSKASLGPRAAAVAAASCWAAASGGRGDGREARGGIGRALGRLKEQQTA